MEAVTQSAKDQGKLQICLRDSRCRAFWDGFQKGRTPFAESDPIRLLEHAGRYWVTEGRHRVCLAKRAGVGMLEAIVFSLPEDTQSLLPQQGEPGQFSFWLSYVCRGRKLEDVRGEAAFLWVEHPALSEKFAWGKVWLTAPEDTGGSFREVLPGVAYRVSVARKRLHWGLFRSSEEIVVNAEVVVKDDHPKTKIWLMKVPVGQIPAFRFGLGTPPSFETVYRYGCWRRGHLRQLSRMYNFF